MVPSSISRYRLAILAVTALAAGCSIYYIRENFWHERTPGQGLRRRNAIHRPRPRPTRRETADPSVPMPQTRVSRAMIDAALRVFDERGSDYEYGHYFGTVTGEINVSCLLRRNMLPSPADLQQSFGLNFEQAAVTVAGIRMTFVEAVLFDLFRPRITIGEIDLQYLIAGLESRGLTLTAAHAASMNWVSVDLDTSHHEGSESEASRRLGRPLTDASGLRQHPPDEVNDFGQRNGGDPQNSELARGGPITWADPSGFPQSVSGEDVEGLATRGATDDESKRDGQGLLNLLYYIAEDQSRKDGYVHRKVTCNQCNACPIRGIRYRCANCVDFDLCEQCESTQQHTSTHIFYKVRIPAPFAFLGNPRQSQPIWYPGKPQNLPTSLERDVIQRFSRMSKFEESEVAALWDQFRCLACEPWNDDSNQLHMAIDHSTFDRCFMPNLSLRSPPNLLYDLMFSFYDTDRNGLIGFEEFIIGLACLREKGGKANHKKLEHIFSGYDLDHDGYVCRKDFLRIFRAYYALMKELTREFVAGMEEDASDNNQGSTLRDIATGSQPLSSAFSGSIPRGQPSRTGEGKTLNRFGDLILPQGHQITRESHDEEGDHHEIIGDVFEQNRFGNIRSPIGSERFHMMLNPETASAYAMIYNLGDGLLEDQDSSNSVEGEEYAPNDDRDISGVTGNVNRGENAGALRQWTDSTIWPPDWIDPSDTENALGCNSQLEDITDHADRCKVIRAAMGRMAQEDRDNRHSIRDEGILARWQRRHFYLDEEDGATQPEGYNEELWEVNDAGSIDNMVSEHTTINGHSRSSRRSRSSSKVRFEDEVIDEPYVTRSRSSTSLSSRSIPVGERWGGYDIPDPEKDVGREVLYQVTHEALNEMLDPIFKYREDLAMEALRTRAHRAISGLQEHYTRVPQLEKFVATELHELLKQWRNFPEQGPRGRRTWNSDLLLFLQHVVKEEPIFGAASNGFLLKVCQAFGLSQAQALFQTKLPDVNVQDSTSTEDQGSRDKREERGGFKIQPDLNQGVLQQESTEEKRPTTSTSPAYQDDPDVIYPEAALQLQEGVSAFNEIDSTPREAIISNKPLSELLKESEYAVATPELSATSAPTLESGHSPSLDNEDSTPDPTLPQNRPNSSHPSTRIDPPKSNPGLDPTLPQNRPNDIPPSAPVEPDETQEKPGPSFRFADIKPHRQTLPDGPIEPWMLKYYAFLDCIEKEGKERGGPGRMNFAEFEECMNSDQGKSLSFVGAWIDLASF